MRQPLHWFIPGIRSFEQPGQEGTDAAAPDRPVVAALAGAAYGLLAIRFGLGSAIVAHVVTNLLLALHVIFSNSWSFW